MILATVIFGILVLGLFVSLLVINIKYDKKAAHQK